MRTLLKFGLFVAIACTVVNFTGGQQYQGVRGGVAAGKTQTDFEALLRNPSVKKELLVTAEQESKIPAAVLEAMGKVLSPDQVKRLSQIELQTRDHKVFGDPDVQAALKMNAGQKNDIKAILTDAEKQTQALLKDMPGGFGGQQRGGNGGQRGNGGGAGGYQGYQGNPEIQTKLQAIVKETKDRCQEVLSASQRRAWADMIGDEFKLGGQADSTRKKGG